jgi:NAD(P)-dependent dehydrogenase (short-subunit alcohol dehydrogenase family)
MSKRVLITGGGSGIGKTMAETFAAEGARIFITDLSDTALAECPDSWLKMTGDASDPAHMRAVFDHIESEWGGIDVLCANAGIAGPTARVEDVALEDFRRCVAVNLDGAFLAAKYAAPMMKAAGSGVILSPPPPPGSQRLSQPRALCGGEMGGDRADEDAGDGAWSAMASAPTRLSRAASRGRAWRACSRARPPPRAPPRPSFAPDTRRACLCAPSSPPRTLPTWRCFWPPTALGWFPAR